MESEAPPLPLRLGHLRIDFLQKHFLNKELQITFYDSLWRLYVKCSHIRLQNWWSSASTLFSHFWQLNSFNPRLRIVLSFFEFLAHWKILLITLRLVYHEN